MNDDDNIIELVAKARVDISELIIEIKDIRAGYDGAQSTVDPKSIIKQMRNENRKGLNKKFNSLKDNIQSIIDLPDDEEIGE